MLHGCTGGFYCLSRSLRKSSLDFVSLLLLLVPLSDVFVTVLATVAATFFCTERGMNDNRGFWSLQIRKELKLKLWAKRVCCENCTLKITLCQWHFLDALVPVQLDWLHLEMMVAPSVWWEAVAKLQQSTIVKRKLRIWIFHKRNVHKCRNRWNLDLNITYFDSI